MQTCSDVTGWVLVSSPVHFWFCGSTWWCSLQGLAAMWCCPGGREWSTIVESSLVPTVARWSTTWSRTNFSRVCTVWSRSTGNIRWRVTSLNRFLLSPFRSQNHIAAKSTYLVQCYCFVLTSVLRALRPLVGHQAPQPACKLTFYQSPQLYFYGDGRW